MFHLCAIKPIAFWNLAALVLLGLYIIVNQICLSLFLNDCFWSSFSTFFTRLLPIWVLISFWWKVLLYHLSNKFFINEFLFSKIKIRQYCSLNRVSRHRYPGGHAGGTSGVVCRHVFVKNEQKKLMSILSMVCSVVLAYTTPIGEQIRCRTKKKPRPSLIVVNKTCQLEQAIVFLISWHDDVMKWMMEIRLHSVIRSHLICLCYRSRLQPPYSKATMMSTPNVPFGDFRKH